MDQILLLEEQIELATKIGESHYREFKSALQGAPSDKTPRPSKEICSDIGKTLVAFANADGGELFVGIEDDGQITGLQHTADQIELMKNAYQSHVHPDTPLPKPKVHICNIKDKQVLYFSITKGNQYAYLTSDGKCLKRSDLESIPVGSEKIISERLEHESRNWDRNVYDSASFQDLDLELINQVSNQIAYGVTPEKCLQHLGLAEFTPAGMKLKNAALILFAKDVRKYHPGCFVRIFTINGKERRSGEAYNIIKEDLVADNVVKLVESAWERLSYALTMHTSLSDHAKFKQSYLYPQIACREALINAIVHRNYAIQGRGIEISIFSDRLEISSPGKLLSTISLSDIQKLNGTHESRNPLIARVLREVGYVREMGEGIRRIYDVMRSNALAEPELASGNDNFTVTLYHRSLYDPKVKLWLSMFDKFRLTENQTAVLALGFEGKEFSTQDIIDRLGIVDTDQVREILSPLRSIGIVIRTKTTQNAYNFAKNNKVPKRSVPIYKVDQNLAKEDTHEEAKTEEIEDEFQPTNEINLFIGGLDYSLKKEQLVAAINEHFDVLNIHMPTGIEFGSSNKGFAFTDIDAKGNSVDLVLQKLNQIRINGRKLSVKLNSKY